MTLASLVSTPSVSWLAWLFWIAVAASIGGVFIFIGLLFETLAEKDKFPTLANFRKWKQHKRWGEILVLIGVGFEIISTGVFAIRGEIEIRNIREAEAKNDPMQKVVANVSAVVTFDVNRTYLSDLPHNSPSPWLYNAFALMHMCGTNMAISEGGMVTMADHSPGVLVADGYEHWNSTIGIGNIKTNEIMYSMNFSWATVVKHSWRRAGGQEFKVVDMYNDVKGLVVQCDVLPYEAEILGGTVDLVINSTTHKTFRVIPHKNPTIGLGQKPSAFTTLIYFTDSDATNFVTTGQK